MAQPAGPSSSLPRDAKLVISVLESMGVEEYEPRVLTGLLEYMHRYRVPVPDRNRYRYRHRYRGVWSVPGSRCRYR